MNRPSFLFIPALLLMTSTTLHAEEILMLIASPADPSAIYASTLNTETGEMSELTTAAGDVSTGFMAMHPSRPIVYAATRETREGDAPNGGVRAYRLQRKLGTLKLINEASTEDNGTTHIAVDAQGQAVVVCHYSGTGTSALPLQKNGKLKNSVSKIVHQGKSVHPSRQQGPHPHGIAISADGRFVFVADLGNDRVEVFRMNEKAQLSEHSAWKAKPGAGPRHVSFHPNGKWLYCINELDSTLAVLHFDASTGELTESQTVTTLPEGFSETNSTAEVVIHPNGRFLYGSNRGHNSTAVFAVDDSNGHLTLVEHEATQGDHPRFVGLEPTGAIYVAANMRENNLVSFRINQDTGALEPTGHKLEVQRPMCILFVK